MSKRNPIMNKDVPKSVLISCPVVVSFQEIQRKKMLNIESECNKNYNFKSYYNMICLPDIVFFVLLVNSVVDGPSK